MGESRTKNAIKNFNLGAVSQVVNTLIMFFVRTVFIKTLGEEYLGVNGLFTNILTVLSFAELGIGNAIIYSMYKPISEDDKSKINGLLKLYKKSYTIIGIIVISIGLLIAPFIKFLIKDSPNISENLILIYILFLANTSLSYFFTYKKSIISAHQKEYVINNYRIVFHLIKGVLQILFLLLTRNFILYLLIQILCTLLENISLSRKANKMYAYIKNKEKTDVSKEEKRQIFKNVKALVVYKFRFSNIKWNRQHNNIKNNWYCYGRDIF